MPAYNAPNAVMQWNIKDVLKAANGFYE